MKERSIFRRVLGNQMMDLPEPIQTHFSHSTTEPYNLVLKGEMERIWHRPRWIKPILSFLSKQETLFPETGQGIPVVLRNRAYRDDDGRECMDWDRTFSFPEQTRFFKATMKYDDKRNTIVDYFGLQGRLEVDLHIEPWKEANKSGLSIISHQYRYRIGSTAIRLPGWLVPRATILEWWEPGMGDEIMIEVVIHHRLIGDFFGYYGKFVVGRETK